LSANQFGFRKGRSTADALVEFVSEAQESLNANTHLMAAFLDFNKVFDTVDRVILLKKLDIIELV